MCLVDHLQVRGCYQALATVFLEMPRKKVSRLTKSGREKSALLQCDITHFRREMHC